MALPLRSINLDTQESTTAFEPRVVPSVLSGDLAQERQQQNSVLNLTTRAINRLQPTHSVNQADYQAPEYGSQVVRVRKFASGKIVVTGCTKYGGQVVPYSELEILKRRESLNTKLDICVESQRTFQLAGVEHTLPPRTKFTQRLKDNLLDAGEIMHRECNGTATFMTLTLPGSTEEAYAALALKSGYVVNRIGTWLRRRFPEIKFAYVWELQKRGALHLHYMVGTRSPSEAGDLVKQHKRLWISILFDISNELGIDMFEREDGSTWRDQPSKVQTKLVIIREGTSHYIAKYASKSKSKSNEDARFYPGRWGAVSYNMHKAIRSERCEFECTFPRLEDAHQAVERLHEQFMPTAKGAKFIVPHEAFMPLGTVLQYDAKDAENHFLRLAFAAQALSRQKWWATEKALEYVSEGSYESTVYGGSGGGRRYGVDYIPSDASRIKTGSREWEVSERYRRATPVNNAKGILDGALVLQMRSALQSEFEGIARFLGNNRSRLVASYPAFIRTKQRLDSKVSV